VINIIQAHFHFQDGLIIKHTDDFDVWKWSKQALGIKEFYLVGLAICKKKYTKRQFHRLLDIKNSHKMIETLKILFNRDLNRLKSEIGLYDNENDIWKVQKE
jgi:hypothetical protein